MFLLFILKINKHSIIGKISILYIYGPSESKPESYDKNGLWILSSKSVLLRISVGKGKRIWKEQGKNMESGVGVHVFVYTAHSSRNNTRISHADAIDLSY